MERNCLIEPPMEIFDALRDLAACADALLRQEAETAADLFRRADNDIVRRYTSIAQGGYPDPDINKQLKAEGAKIWGKSVLPPSGFEDRPRRAQRDPHAHLEASVIARDGYFCRYCGIPVVDKKICNAMLKHFSPTGEIPSSNASYNATLLAVKFVCDHVFPYQLGGENEESNLVACCGTCNYGKGAYTLEQLQLTNPLFTRCTPPDGFKNWDGLTRLKSFFNSANLR